MVEARGVAITVRVKYVFGLRQRDSEGDQAVELPSTTTVFELLRKLGLSGLELLTAVNGASVADGTLLEDGDEVLLVPAIQGGVDA